MSQSEFSHLAERRCSVERLMRPHHQASKQNVGNAVCGPPWGHSRGPLMSLTTAKKRTAWPLPPSEDLGTKIQYSKRGRLKEDRSRTSVDPFVHVGVDPGLSSLKWLGLLARGRGMGVLGGGREEEGGKGKGGGDWKRGR